METSARSFKMLIQLTNNVSHVGLLSVRRLYKDNLSRRDNSTLLSVEGAPLANDVSWFPPLNSIHSIYRHPYKVNLKY